MVIIITDKYLESTYVKVHSWRWRWPKKPHAFPAAARWVDSCSRSFCETCCSSASCRRASSNSACIWQNESDCNVCDREKHRWIEGSRVETHCPRLPGIRIKLINPSSQGLLSNISHEPAEAVWLHLAFRLPRVVQCFHHVLPVESEQQNCGSKVETFHFSIFTPFAAAHCVHVTVRLSTQAVPVRFEHFRISDRSHEPAYPMRSGALWCLSLASQDFSKENPHVISARRKLTQYIVRATWQSYCSNYNLWANFHYLNSRQTAARPYFGSSMSRLHAMCHRAVLVDPETHKVWPSLWSQTRMVQATCKRAK